MDSTQRQALVRAIAEEVARQGGRAMLVGGCVRDALLGLPGKDVDCEVYGLPPQALAALAARFGKVDASGARYGVYTLRDADIDLAVPRTERRTGPRHTDFTVTLNPALSPECAVARRDFTINAILRDALTGELVDPFGGRADLEGGVLRRVPGGQFEEDPLRVLRGAQFAARFRLTPDADTCAAMARMPLTALSAPRVLGELQKALLYADEPGRFFTVLAQAEALHPWFAEVDALRGVPQNPRYHPEGDAFTHTMMVLNEAAAVRTQARDPLAFMLAALAHDLGKAETTRQNERGDWQSIGHEQASARLAPALLHRLTVSRARTGYVVNLCRLHMRVHTCYYQSARVSRTNLLFDEACDARELGLLAVCDARGTGKPRAQADAEEGFIAERLVAYEAARAQMPTAAMLMAEGIAPGEALSAALREGRRLALCGADAQQAAKRAARKVMQMRCGAEEQQTGERPREG